MEEKINIAEILKDKPVNTKLYSPLFGDVYFSHVEDSIINVEHHAGVSKFFNSGRYYNYDESEPLLFPSMEMRDWEKFSWKRGDVLVNSRGLKILFDRWANNNYTSFYAKTINLVEDGFLDTNLHTLASKKEAKSFIKCIEEKLGGKLNRETLKIEKAQPEFKDGDIVVYGKSVAICRKICKHTLFPYVSIDETSRLLFNDNPNVSPDECRFAKEEEKQQLFDALAKEGKAWDAEKKEVIDLKPNVDELKPFDKVVVRCSEADRWSIDFFSYKAPNGYICTGDAWFGYCLPYNEETAKLIGTTKDMEVSYGRSF